MTAGDHLTWGELLTVLEGADPEAELRRHLKSCTDCRDRLERLRGWMDALPDALDPGAPDLWVHRAQRRVAPRGFLGPLRGSHVARVVFDSAQDRRVGVRSEGDRDRQWLLATERLEIEVTLSDPRERAPFGLTGQIFSVAGAPPPLAGCLVRLDVDGRTRDQTRSEPHGEFLLRERPSSAFQLVVEGDGWTVATPVLEP